MEQKMMGWSNIMLDSTFGYLWSMDFDGMDRRNGRKYNESGL